jgi:hypothetical protein
MRLASTLLIATLIAAAAPASAASQAQPDVAGQAQALSTQELIDAASQDEGTLIYILCLLLTPGPECQQFYTAAIAACRLLPALLAAVCIIIV